MAISYGLDYYMGITTHPIWICYNVTNPRRTM